MPHAAWNQVTEVRRRMPVFVMPAAESMARIGHWYREPDNPCLRGLAESSALCSRQLLDALAELPLPQFDTVAAAEIDCRLSEDPHDAFFRIARTHEPAAMALARATVQALRVFIEETSDACERADYAGLCHALHQVLSEVLAQPVAPPVPVPVPVLSPMPSPIPAAVPQLLMRAPVPLRRWLRGHQIFAVLTQGLIRQLHRVVREVESASDAALSSELDRMAALYRASALAFRFTADFEPAIYADTIRPSMCEPYTPKGFSGTLSSDHGVLVRLLVGSREPLAVASLRCPQAYESMRGAIAAVYDDHKWVCARFDGDRSPSLRTSSFHGDSTAVDMLDRFRTRRMAMLP